MIDPRLEPLYYLRNFSSAMDWLAQIYADLLSDEERTFIQTFAQLPTNAQALFVRLIMRKGDCFRSSTIRYPEIGDVTAAATPLVAAALLDDEPLLTLEELFGLSRRDEIHSAFELDSKAKALTKPDLLKLLSCRYLHARTFDAWFAGTDERVYRVCTTELCANLRLLFFGSFHQDWSEFVLADLGIFKYEQLDLGVRSRGFQTRQDIESFYVLHRCRTMLFEDASLSEVHALVPSEHIQSTWLEARRAKILFEIAYRYERQQDLTRALAVYRQSKFPGARLRSIRLLERAGDIVEALDLALEAHRYPESAAEQQGLERIIPRLYRAAGIDVLRPAQQTIPHLELSLTPNEVSVEEAVRRHLQSDDAAPVFYVENSLINSLFGLLFWDAIFAPLPGAFFHRFHSAPMDLYDPSFEERRRSLIDDCFAQLTNGRYESTICNRFKDKQGVVSPFVAWGLIDERLLQLALRCIAPQHLALLFRRILDDIRDNCTGLPDLIQFWPEEKRYQLIEVKGPGDRLQDHQKRWAEFCSALQIPFCVAYVRWAEAQA